MCVWLVETPVRVDPLFVRIYLPELMWQVIIANEEDRLEMKNEEDEKSY